MPPEDIEKFVKARPFEPFRITLTTGETYDVRHSDLIMIGRRSVTVGLTKKPKRTYYDRIVTIALIHIVQLEPGDAAKDSNGKGP